MMKEPQLVNRLFGIECELDVNLRVTRAKARELGGAAAAAEQDNVCLFVCIYYNEYNIT